MRSTTRGFTLVELATVLFLLVAIAGVLTPLVVKERKCSLRAEALTGTHRIAVGVSDFLSQTLRPPIQIGTSKTLSYLFSNGQVPNGVPFAPSQGASIEKLLRQNPGTEGWDGPYMDRDTEADPWGRAFIVFVTGFVHDDAHVWILSAGPNGSIDTHPTETQPSGDDIGIMIQ